MTVYVGPRPPGAGLVFWTVCFTGSDAMLFRGLVGLLNILGSIGHGMVLGVLLSLVFGPEVVPQVLGAILGGIAGAITGCALTAWTLISGRCAACVPPADGFCVDFSMILIPGVVTPIPTWPYTTPNSAACPVLVPPGCP